MAQGNWHHQKSHHLAIDKVMQAYIDYLPQYLHDGCPISIQLEEFFVYIKNLGYTFLCDKQLDAKETTKQYPCNIIHRSLYIGPNGAVTPCMSICGIEVEKQFPNLFQTPLSEILTNSSYAQMTTKHIDFVLNHNDECQKCEYRYRCCGGCRAQAICHNNTDYFSKDPITCEMFKNGWIDKIIMHATEVFGKNKQINKNNITY